MTDFLTTAQFAARLKITDGRVKQLIESGTIEATKFGAAWMIPASQIAVAGKRRGRGRPPKVNTAG